MKRLIKGVAGSVLFAVCCALGAGFTMALARHAGAAGREFTQGRLLWFTVGAVAYLPVHILFRRLIIVHVFGHELTHALWSMLFGGKVREIYVSGREGGYTTYTKGNFLVSLAPYFFPLYALVFLGLYKVVEDRYKAPLLFLIGFSAAFHVLLTLHSIRVGQADLRETGMVFSLAFIYLMNCVVLGFLLCALSPKLGAVDFLKDGASVFKRAGPAAAELYGEYVVKRR